MERGGKKKERGTEEKIIRKGKEGRMGTVRYRKRGRIGGK